MARSRRTYTDECKQQYALIDKSFNLSENLT